MSQCLLGGISFAMASRKILDILRNDSILANSYILHRVSQRDLKLCKLVSVLPSLSQSVPPLSTCKYDRTKKSRFGRFTATVGIGLGVGLSLVSFHLYNRRDLKIDVTKFRLPVVHAAEVFDPGVGSSSAYVSPPGSAVKNFNFIADVVERAAPAVVYIEIKARHPFFGERPIAVSNGSGFIVSSDGVVVTNAHVVANMRSVTVKLYDGRVFEGQVRTFDRDSDLATIKINAKNLPVVKLGNSSKVRPGEWVVAMGSPLSLSNTITAGVISSVNRGSRELGLRKEMEYIQTDAAINFGNSGGPLVNLDGEVVGINTMKVTTGISFAIPVDYVADFLRRSAEIEAKSAKSKGWLGTNMGGDTSTRKHYLGVTMLTLNPNLILELQQRSPDFPLVQSGVLVWKVIVGSPAHWGGIQPGDIITGINDKPVHTAKDVYAALGTDSPIIVTVRRKREVLKLRVTPQESD